MSSHAWRIGLSGEVPMFGDRRDEVVGRRPAMRCDHRADRSRLLLAGDRTSTLPCALSAVCLVRDSFEATRCASIQTCGSPSVAWMWGWEKRHGPSMSQPRQC